MYKINTLKIKMDYEKINCEQRVVYNFDEKGKKEV